MNIEQIGVILGLAGSAVGLTEKAASTIASIKEHFERGDIQQDAETVRLLNLLVAELTSVNMMNVQLSASVRSLSNEVQLANEFANQAARYELVETPEKSLVYRLKESEANGEPIHYICPVCMKRDKLISYLDGSGDYKTCQTSNEHVFRFQETPLETYRVSSEGLW